MYLLPFSMKGNPISMAQLCRHVFSLSPNCGNIMWCYKEKCWLQRRSFIKEKDVRPIENSLNGLKETETARSIIEFPQRNRRQIVLVRHKFIFADCLLWHSRFYLLYERIAYLKSPFSSVISSNRMRTLSFVLRKNNYLRLYYYSRRIE